MKKKNIKALMILKIFNTMKTLEIMDNNVDTIFLTTSLQYAYLSSSIVKEVAINNGDVSKFVPEYVVEQIQKKLNISNL